jgi:hypothetical protein
MSRGFVLFVQQNNQTDYLKQAVACALSIKKFNANEKVCLITDIDVPTQYQMVFDFIKDIPGEDLAHSSNWKVENRCKIYDVAPFDRNIVLDVDMLVLENIDHWWKALEQFELFYTNKVQTYRHEWAKTDYYRKVFIANDLPNVYCGFHYFIKNKANAKFYETLKNVVVNYKTFAQKFTINNTQTWCSMDVATAIAIKLMNKQHSVFSNINFLTFTHMKPRCQNWRSTVKHWNEQVDYMFNKDCELYVANIQQHGIFHYVEDSFLTDEIMENLK